jgi:hypothetical protein
MSSSYGTVAAIVWIVAGALLYNSEPETRLISWQTPVYFVLGMFVAGALFGKLHFAIVRGVSSALIKAKIVTEPTPRAAMGLAVTGGVIAALEAVGIYLIARQLIRVMF